LADGMYRTRSALEEELGMLYYSSPPKAGTGIGGHIRCKAKDFIVEEVTREGAIAGPSLGELSRGEGRYSLAVLSKISRDLLPTAAEISRLLCAEVGFAGIKDRRAVTHQLISIGRNVEQAEVQLGLKNVRLRVVGSSALAILPGELRGNRFTITIRCLQEDAALEAPEWLPGYFGHQRFGTTRPNTHKIGRLVVRGEYECAVREFLAEPYPDEPERVRAARLELKNGWDLERSYREFPPALNYERAVMKRLLLHPADYEGALKYLPASLLRLFVNAYQSYLFNHAISTRWAAHGLSSVHEGDFVGPLDRWGSPSRPIKAGASNIGALRRMVSSGKAVVMVRVLGRKTRFEGVDVEAYSGLLENEGISQEDFGRLPLMRPSEGTLRFATFRSMRFSVRPPEEDDMNPGMSKAVVRTTLPKSCYATVLLREIMRPENPFGAGF